MKDEKVFKDTIEVNFDLRRNFTPPSDFKKMILDRTVSIGDVKKQRLEVMPGFKVSWYYSCYPCGIERIRGLRQIENKYSSRTLTKAFVRKGSMK